MSDVYDLKQVAENKWQARYHGNYGNYTIKITLGNNFKVENFSCDCPSDYSPCKHINYVLSEIKSKKSQFETQKQKNEVTVETILKKLSFEELSNFVVEQAKYSSDLTKSFMLKFADKIKTSQDTEEFDDDENPYSSIIADEFFDVEFDIEDYYNNYYDDCSIDLDFLNDWLKKAKEFVEQGKYDDAVNICKACIEEFANWIDEQDNSEYNVEDFIYEDYMDKFFGLLTNMVANKQIDKNLLYDYCKNEIEEKKYENFNIFDYFNDLMVITVTENNIEEFVNFQQKLVKKADSAYAAEKILKRLYDFYISINQKEKAEQILENNLQIDNFRKQVVIKCIENKDFIRAKKLINEIDINKNREWKELLLQIAKLENDIPTIQKYYLEFLKDSFKKEYFTIYKSTFNADDWSVAFENLYNFYEKRGNSWNCSYNENSIQLLCAENLPERILNFIENKLSIELLERYYKNISDKYPQKTLLLFKKSLDDYAAKNMGRDCYEYVKKILLLMQKISGGEEIVKLMLQNYRSLYKGRRAMMEILGKD